MTWPGAYGRAQASAQMHPYAAEKNVDVRTALWDGDLAEVTRHGGKRQYQGRCDRFRTAHGGQGLPAGPAGKDRSRHPAAGRGRHARGPRFRARRHRALLGGQHGLFPGDGLFAPASNARPQTLADFFDRKKFPGRRALSRAAPKFNLEMALLADGVAPGDVYKTLDTPEGLDRAFAKLTALQSDLGA